MLTPEERAALETVRRWQDDRSSDSIDEILIALGTVADVALREHPEDDDCELSRQELIELVKWIDNKLDQCDFPRHPNKSLKGKIQGSMHCVVADSQAYHRFVKLQKVANQQLELASHINAIREEMGLHSDDGEPVTEEWLDVIAPRGDRLVNLWALYDARGCRHFMQHGHNCFYIDSQPVVHRWQVRQYAEVFGIELNNESASE